MLTQVRPICYSVAYMNKEVKRLILDLMVPTLAALALAAFLLFIFSFNNALPSAPRTKSPTPTPSPKATPPPVASKIMLQVPYIAETPDLVWTGPWKNGCEEASIAMVDKFYKGKKAVSVAEAKQFMQKLFDAQNILYGGNDNSDATRTNYLINNYSSFKGTIKTNPTLEQIKTELRAGHPVISLHRGFDLHNENIPFLATASSYHMMVIKGYDDKARRFIVNDDGDLEAGNGLTYGYSLFMNSLHDYVVKTNLANGPATVIFTSPK